MASVVARNAQIAQSVEQGIENPRVGGSIPPLGTTSFFYPAQPQLNQQLAFQISAQTCQCSAVCSAAL